VFASFPEVGGKKYIKLIGSVGLGTCQGGVLLEKLPRVGTDLVWETFFV